MKKKMLAFVLSLALAFSGMTLLGATDGSERAAAAGSVSGGDVNNGGSGGTQQTTQLPAPMNVRLGDYYTVYFDLPDGVEGAWSCRYLYKTDGTAISGISYSYRKGANSWCAAEDIMESGTYYIELYTRPAYDDKEHTESEHVRTANFTYTKPSKQLGTTVAKWSETEIGKATCPVVDGASFYWIHLYKKYDNGWRSLCATSVRYISDGIVTVDFQSEINGYGEGQYRIRVEAISSNIDEIANGGLGDWSDIYETTQTAQEVAASLDAAIAANPGDAAAAVEALKADQDIKTIQTAMQTDSTVLNKVKALEDSYKTQQGVEVLPPAVSAPAAQYVKASDISVVGAAFNAAQNTSIGLQVSVPAKPVPVSTGYINNVQLEIKLVNAGQNKGQLDMPVTITMPIPAGLNPAQLVILHNHADGSVEKIYPRVSGGYVTFTVTSFSTFVFANEAEETSDNGEGSGSSGGSGNWTGDVIDSIKSAQDGAVVKISGVTTLTADMLRALRDKKTVSLQLDFTYQGVEHTVLIPAGKVVLRDDVYYYGPMFLLSLYGEMAPGSVAGGDAYTVMSGDTLGRLARLNGTTVAKLMEMNPQIKNADRIWAGQKIRLK